LTVTKKNVVSTFNTKSGAAIQRCPHCCHYCNSDVRSSKVAHHLTALCTSKMMRMMPVKLMIFYNSHNATEDNNGERVEILKIQLQNMCKKNYVELYRVRYRNRMELELKAYFFLMSFLRTFLLYDSHIL
jgi:hypothetical protein